MSENVLLMFSSKSLMVSCHIHKSLSHFEFIFVYDVRVCSNFIDLHAVVQLSQQHLLKKLSFLHCIYSCFLCWRIIDIGVWVYFQALSSVSLIHMTVPRYCLYLLQIYSQKWAPPHAKSWLIGKDSDAGRDWGREEKGTTEDEMAGWHHRLDAHEFGWTPGVGDGQGGLACHDSWSCRELDTTERLNWTELNWIMW